MSNGGQGVHPIKGGDAVVEQVRSQAHAARVCETQGCWLHPETDEMAQRTQRKKRSTSTIKITKGVGESGRQEQGGTKEQVVDGDEGTLNVVAAEKAAGAQCKAPPAEAEWERKRRTGTRQDGTLEAWRECTGGDGSKRKRTNTEPHGAARGIGRNKRKRKEGEEKVRKVRATWMRSGAADDRGGEDGSSSSSCRKEDDGQGGRRHV